MQGRASVLEQELLASISQGMHDLKTMRLLLGDHTGLELGRDQTALAVERSSAEWSHYPDCDPYAYLMLTTLTVSLT